MAWTTPPDAINGAIIQASFWNTGGRDNLKYLKGQAGTIVFEAGASFAGAVSVAGALTATGGLTGTVISGTSAILTGTLSLDNAQSIRSKDSGGTVLPILFMDASNATRVGHQATAGVTFDIPNSDTGLLANRAGVGTVKVWNESNDGPGSLLDADTVDGVQESALAKLASANFTALQQGGNTVITTATLPSAPPAPVVWGTYNGNGGSTARQITVGFVPKYVILSGGTIAGNVEIAHITTASGGAADNNAGNVYPITTVKLRADDGFTVGDGATAFNVTSVTYFYLAFR